MPQFDLKGRGDVAGAISKGTADMAAKNPNGPKAAGMKPAVTKSDSSDKKTIPVPGTLNYFMRKTEKDGKGNAKNRAYTMWKRYKQSQRRGS
jgi:hypothetical protein